MTTQTQKNLTARARRYRPRLPETKAWVFAGIFNTALDCYQPRMGAS